MAWTFSDGTPYVGPTHTLGGRTYSGATRTRESRRLLGVADELRAKVNPDIMTAAELSSLKPKKKAAPKKKTAAKKK